MSPKDLDPEVWRLFDQYVHGAIDRRAFLERAAKYVIGGMTAAGLLGILSPNFAAAEKVPKDDKRLVWAPVEIPSPSGYGKIKGVLSRPAGKPRKRPAIVVIHENRGLNPHIEDVARRFALEGYLVLAPDALTTQGGYPGNEDDARTLFQKLDQEKIHADFVAATKYLMKHAESTGKVGVVGFCYGGAMASWLASQLPELGAAVSFYGRSPTPIEASKIKAPLLLHYAGTDEAIDASIPGFEAALKAARVNYQMFRYAGTQHGFHNDTTPRFDEAAAKLAWERTLAHFKQYL